MDKRWVGCDVEASFLGDDRKRDKQERKEKKAKDRTKFKKTDKDKWEAKQVLENQRGREDVTLCKGRVLAIHPESVIVDYEGVKYGCRLRGFLKKEKSSEKTLVAVGDFVEFAIQEKDKGTIYSILERKSVLQRADNLSRRQAQLIAANIDQVFITMSVVLPPLKPFLADRYIIAADKGGMTPIIVINKIDLLKTASDEEKETYEEFKKGYLKTGIPCVSVSTVTGEGLDTLREMMKGKASVFSGQSGVGKSSLINAMTGLNLAVSSPVEKTQKGAHTTTKAELIPLPQGGFCIDTPGIKSFGVWNLTRDEVESYFDEIHALGAGCKFPDCCHLHEKDCAVKKAVEEGALSPLRYGSYITLLETVDVKHVRR